MSITKNIENIFFLHFEFRQIPKVGEEFGGSNKCRWLPLGALFLFVGVNNEGPPMGGGPAPILLLRSPNSSAKKITK